MALSVAGYMSLSKKNVADGGGHVVGGMTAAQWQQQYQREVTEQVCIHCDTFNKSLKGF